MLLSVSAASPLYVCEIENNRVTLERQQEFLVFYPFIFE